MRTYRRFKTILIYLRHHISRNGYLRICQVTKNRNNRHNKAKALTLKNIELQHWMNEMNNDVRRDADRNKEMRTHRKFKTIENYRCEDYLRHSSAD